MNKLLKDLKIIEKFSQDMRGVFMLSDLKAMFPTENVIIFYRRLAHLEDSNIIKRFTRGIYITEGFDPAVLSQKICANSYISFETVLARELIIGTVPANTIRAVKLGKKKEYKHENFTVTHVGVAKDLFFGFENKDGVNFATKEKAVLDTLYFYSKGLSFYFDIYSDMNLELIDKKVLNGYLTRYKNPKFIKFVENFFKEQNL